MLTSLRVSAIAVLLALAGTGCAAPSDDDEGPTESASFAAKKSPTRESESTSSALTTSVKVSSTCVAPGSASVRVAVELTSGSSDTVVVSIEGGYSDSLTITSNAWSKQKGGSNWAFVASTTTLDDGDYTISVGATQSSVSTPACGAVGFVVACR